MTAIWTAPRTWADDEFVTGAILNTHLRDNLDYLIDKFGKLAGALQSDVTGSRAIDTDYTNSTGYTLMVYITIRGYHDVGGTKYHETRGYIDGSAISTVAHTPYYIVASSNAGNQSSHTLLVPPGSTYKGKGYTAGSTDYTLIKWYEAGWI